MIEFPKNANIPPVIGEYSYYHAEDAKIKYNSNKHIIKYDKNGHGTNTYLCDIKDDNGIIHTGCLVHYSLPENVGSQPWITCMGTIEKIVHVNEGSYNYITDTRIDKAIRTAFDK